MSDLCANLNLNMEMDFGDKFRLSEISSCLKHLEADSFIMLLEPEAMLYFSLIFSDFWEGVLAFSSTRDILVCPLTTTANL